MEGICVPVLGEILNQSILELFHFRHLICDNIFSFLYKLLIFLIVSFVRFYYNVPSVVSWYLPFFWICWQIYLLWVITVDVFHQLWKILGCYLFKYFSLAHFFSSLLLQLQLVMCYSVCYCPTDIKCSVLFFLVFPYQITSADLFSHLLIPSMLCPIY